MELTVVVGIVVGILATLFAVAVTILAVSAARRSMHSAATIGVAAIAKSELKNLLLQLNHADHPFRLTPASDTDLTVEWCIADARWIEVLGPASSKITYRAWILLEESKRTVKYWEQLAELNVFAGGGAGATSDSHASRGFELWGRRTSRRWGVRPDFSVGEVLSYDFTPADVKDLVRQIANDHGWHFQLVLWKHNALHHHTNS